MSKHTYDLSTEFIDNVFKIAEKYCHDFVQIIDINDYYNKCFKIPANRSHLVMALEKLLTDGFVQKNVNSYDGITTSYRITYDGFLKFKLSHRGEPYKDLISSTRNITIKRRLINTAIAVNSIAILIMTGISVYTEYHDSVSDKKINNIEKNIDKIFKLINDVK